MALPDMPLSTFFDRSVHLVAGWDSGPRELRWGPLRGAPSRAFGVLGANPQRLRHDISSSQDPVAP